MRTNIIKLKLGDIEVTVPLELTREYSQEEMETMALSKLKTRANNEYDMRESSKKKKSEYYGSIKW
jgi:hypothetical protein